MAQSPTIEIYTGKTCPYCERAKALLRRKQVEFTEYSIDSDPNIREQMLRRSAGRRTVPQIFIGNQHIGGCDDLYALETAGQLDPMLQCG